MEKQSLWDASNGNDDVQQAIAQARAIILNAAVTANDDPMDRTDAMLGAVRILEGAHAEAERAGALLDQGLRDAELSKPASPACKNHPACDIRAKRAKLLEVLRKGLERLKSVRL